MMKVQRPLCPDITFRLIHDISPDTLGDINEPGELSEKDLRITDFLSDTYNNWIKTSSDITNKNDKNKEYTKSSKIIANDSNKKDMACENDDALRFLEHALKERTPYTKSTNSINNNIVEKNYLSKELICTKNEWNEKQLDNRLSPVDITLKENKPRRPRKLPEIPKKHHGLAAVNKKSLAEELGDVLITKLENDDTDDVFDENSEDAFLRRHAGHLFDRANRSSNTTPRSNRSRTGSNSTDSDFNIDDDDTRSQHPSVISYSSGRGRKGSDDNSKTYFYLQY
ncbi:hypothetical protein LOTGIDRAFT_154738 [Lottia gigantea]|uniref:Uncharacterized protein n=1 Tax=Lottia gigantea TaxID=225164 RepID=V4A1Q7_LOTGI|nr:hypothetical protein LOTGIDRAFT_154738 [Lottia gigantea]ESO87236.1 hypothetical protein LOTGIDRAFT_154738 [Lottia gigantea]